MVIRRSQVQVPLDWNPNEVWLLGLCALSGAQSWHVELAHVPTWAGWLWYGLLVVGGLAGVAGALWRDAITGLLILRAALLPVGAGAYIWAVVVLAAHVTGVVGALVIATFGVAMHWRAAKITGLVRGHLRRPS